MFQGPVNHSILKRAVEQGQLILKIHNLRQWAIDKRGTVDDRPYGGGTGMLLRPEPIFDAVEEIQEAGNGKKELNRESKTILLDAGGKLYTQQIARRYAKLHQLILICGHYEGVDYRVHEYLSDEVISIGDYVLTGGEIPAMVIVDSVVRLLPGVLKSETTKSESFSLEPQTSNPQRPLVEWPQYTRPEIYRGHAVPKVLLSGNHAEIAKWREKKAFARTRKFRPDLL